MGHTDTTTKNHPEHALDIAKQSKNYRISIPRRKFLFQRHIASTIRLKSLTYTLTAIRDSYTPYREDLWYMGPSMEHYRCFKLYIINTNEFFIIVVAKIYPQHFRMLQTSTVKTVQQSTKHLIKTLEISTPGYQ